MGGLFYYCEEIKGGEGSVSYNRKLAMVAISWAVFDSRKIIKSAKRRQLFLFCALNENYPKLKKQISKLSPVCYKCYSADNKLGCKK